MGKVTNLFSVNTTANTGQNGKTNFVKSRLYIGQIKFVVKIKISYYSRNNYLRMYGYFVCFCP